MLSFNIKTAPQKQAQCKLSVCTILKMSRNEEIRTLHNRTNKKNVKSDLILESTRIHQTSYFPIKKKYNFIYSITVKQF